LSPDSIFDSTSMAGTLRRPMIERRDSPWRNTCFFRGFVYFENSTIAADCIVRDISNCGARLQFSVPQKFTEILLIPLKGQSCHAKVRQQDGDEIGIAFHASTKAVSADISLDRCMDQLQSEITAHRQAVRHLPKNNDKKSGSGTAAR
jgi:hypothetical protein